MDFRRKKITKISRTQVHILWGGVPPKKIFSAEILGPNIESAVHSTKPEDEFRLGKGLNTKFRREFFSAEVRYTICVVAFRWKPNYTKVRKNCLQSIRGHKISIFRRFFSADLMPIIGRKKKDRKVRKDLFGKKIWDFNAKFWTLDPTLPCGHGWHMWSGGTCLGNPWKIVWTWWLGNITTHYHGLAPCFLKAPWKEGFV